MGHTPKIIGLVAMLLLIQGDIGLAAKDPPPLSPHQYPPPPAQVQVPRPDLVPKLGPGWPLGQPRTWCYGSKLHVRIDVRNDGTAPAPGGTFKTLVRVNGVIWRVLNNPYTLPVALTPGTHSDLYLAGYAPGPGPIPGKVLVSVKVDSENTVAELNETNNVASVTTAPCK